MDLFIGIPTWNSARFLEPCLRQIAETSRGIRYEIGVLDNGSTDRSVDIARAYGCKVKVHEYLLPDALNRLVSWSNADYTLFIHADTFILDHDWFSRCVSKLSGQNALISPQDIGCGPFTRPWGKNMPESSFMLFRTDKLKALRIIRWVRRFRLKMPQKVVNFYSHNVTHYIPGELQKCGLSWVRMKVHTSCRLEQAIYFPRTKVRYWTNELAYLEYGLGNFYSVDGVITHYHNWYERLFDNDNANRKVDPTGIPLDYIVERSQAFLRDLEIRKVSLPDPAEPEREPQAIPLLTGEH